MNGKQKTPSLMLVSTPGAHQADISDDFSSIDSSSDDIQPMAENLSIEDPLLKAYGMQSLELSSTQESQNSQFMFGMDSQPPEKKSPKVARQMKIFQFARSLDEEEVDDDSFYNTVNRIYVYFNRKRKISVILQAIHESGGSVRNAVELLRNKNYGNDGKLNFSIGRINADPCFVERYFR